MQTKEIENGILHEIADDMKAVLVAEDSLS